MKQMYNPSCPITTALQGTAGILGATFSFVATMIEEINAVLQLCSVAVGLFVSILMAVKIWRDIKRGK